MIAEPFASRWRQNYEKRTNLVLGVAPSPKWLAAWGLDDTPDGLTRFCSHIADAVGTLPAVKLQSPFFERFGAPGLDAMAALADSCHAQGTLVVVDAKRGDAEDTAAAYRDIYLGSGSRLRGDAVTAMPFMGFASLEPLCRMAGRQGCAVMVLVRTSNHVGAVQVARGPDGRSVAEQVADDISTFNRAAGADEIGPAAALVGAPADEARGLLKRMSNALVSLPGLGRPGRTVREFADTVGTAGQRVLLPVTSGLLWAGPGGLAGEIAHWQGELRASGLAP